MVKNWNINQETAGFVCITTHVMNNFPGKSGDIGDAIGRLISIACKYCEGKSQKSNMI